MDPRDKLTELFKSFPGIGIRQARRFVYYLLSRDKSFIAEFTDLVHELKKNIRQCKKCYRFFSGSERDDCDTCAERGESPFLMVVEKDVDFENLHRMDGYDGLFFILGGTIPLTETNPGKHIRAKELLKRLDNDARIKEVILALSVNPEGENTAQYLSKVLEPLAESRGLKISTLGRGLSTGAELEYSDTDTLGYAFKNRS